MNPAMLTILGLLFLLIAPKEPCASERTPGFETIRDVDVEFLLGNPRLPWRKDPFRKLAGLQASDSELEKFQLQGIAYRPESPVAIVDGETLSIGDTFHGRRVVEIGRHYIVLEKGDSLIELVLHPPRGKQP